MTLSAIEPAGAGWSVTSNVSASTWTTYSPQVAVDRQGDAIIVWSGCDGQATYCDKQIQIRQKTPTGTLGPIKTLSPLSWSSNFPQVASDDDGDSIVVWQNSDGRVYGRRVSRTGAVGSLLVLSRTGNPAINPTIAIDPTGTALAAWTEINGGTYDTVVRFIYPNGVLGSPMAWTGNASGPTVAFDRRGMAVVAWTESYDLVAVRRMKPGYFGPRTVFASAISGVMYGRPSVGIDRDGDAAIAFGRGHEGEKSHLWVRQWSRTGTIGTVLSIAPSTDMVGSYKLAMDLEGDYVVAWSRMSTQRDVFARRMYRTGVMGPIAHLGIGDLPAVAVDDDGDGNVTWQYPGPAETSTKVYARRIAKTGAWAASTSLLTPIGNVPQAASSPGGRVAIVWQQVSYSYMIHARFGS